MSIIRCSDCMRFIDTDFETEFYYKDSPEPLCENCLAKKFDDFLKTKEQNND